MIVSASRRTDIPAFYGEWFLNRLDAGYCLAAGVPGAKPYRVDLRPEAVDAFVFWTKNLAPFEKALAEVRARGFPFVVLYTINGYPRCLEPGVPPAESAVRQMHELASRCGPRAAVWRYDPIIFTSATPLDYHGENFGRLAERLSGSTDEVIVSVVTDYRKTGRNVKKAGEEHGFSRHEIPTEATCGLLGDLARTARDHGMRLSLCCQPGLVVKDASGSHCIDAQRLSDVAGRPINAKLKGTRPGCGCCESRDIGAYETCAQGCAYCYAVGDHDAARARLVRHDPQAEML